MSAYKSYTPRRPVELTDSSMNDKLKDKVGKIQELFPSWSTEDLHSVLIETNGDVELAVVRISEGHAEQWGSVPRKKDKKSGHQSTPSSSRGERERSSGDSRGGRGGRGGRGRGGGSRGASRGTGTTNRSRDSGSNTLHDINGTNSVATIAANDVQTSDAKVDGAGTGTNELSITTPQTVDTVLKEPISAPAVSVDSTSDSVKLTDIGPASTQNGLQNALKAPSKTSKVPPGAKLSWAQIARAPEKPKQHVPPSPPRESVFSVTTETAVSGKEEIPPPVQLEEAWEEPTTAQAPTWEDEPVVVTQAPVEPQTTTQDGWIMPESVPPRPTTQEAWDGMTDFTSAQAESPQITEEPVAVAPSPSIGTTSISITTSTASVTTSTALTSKPSTPSVSSARIAPGHRIGARYLKTDQAVVIPAFAGNIGSSGEKLGMQFGSLSLGGEDNLDNTLKSEPEPSVSPAPELHPQQLSAQPQTQAQTPQSQPQPAVQPQIHDTLQPPITPSITTAHSPNQTVFQQQPQASTSSVVHVQTPVQQPLQVAHQAQQPAAGSPFGSQAPPTLGHQQPPLSQAQPPLHGYASQQHGIHSQFDGPSLPQQTTQHAPGPQTGSYFRQTDSPYYHNPTPPQSAPPEHQGAYNAFSLGIAGSAHAQGLGGQSAGGHLGGFGTGGPGDYGYNDGQRGFYDYQPNSFSNRLAHDEPTKAGLPLGQTNQPAGSLGAGTGQPQASNPTQASSGQPPLGQQGQQGYPAPMPYYYPPYYPQNSYPTYPNPSYGQAYMPKYPPVYPHQGPVGPSSAPPPSGKGPGNNAPYNASASQNHLYHSQGAFEDPTTGYQHHQGSANLGAAEYTKQAPHHQQQQQPLYSGQTGQGLQSFLGIQQSAGAGQGVGGPGGPQRSATSPETAYKPYGGAGGASDKGGVGIGSQGNQQGRASGMQPSQQQGGSSFYPGGRFGSAPGGPQQQGQQQGQGYPQATDQSQFYPYQPRHQGGYWQ